MEAKAVPLLPPGNILAGALLSAGGAGGRASSPGPRRPPGCALAFPSQVTAPVLAPGASFRLESLGHEAWFGPASASQDPVSLVGRRRFT